jgi:HD-GYP domain-containing protein (c-di-GMP phosphodiesterase class II)
MTSQRPYNEPLGYAEALAKCTSEAGKHFDPDVIKALARFINKTMSKTAEARVGKQREGPLEARLDS